MVWIAAGATILGGLLGNRGRKKADRQRRQYLAKIEAMSQRLEARGTGYMDTYDREFLPVAREAVDAARRVGRPDFAAINADNATAFQNQRGAMTREMQRAGVNPLDGAWASAMGDVANNEAASLVLNRNSARRGAANDRFSALSSAAGLGLPLLSAGSNLLGQAGSMLAQGGQHNEQIASGIQDRYDTLANSIGALGGTFAGGMKAGGGIMAGGGKSAPGGMVYDNFKGIPWSSFVSRAGPWKPEFGGYGQAPQIPGYLSQSGQNQWWGVGGR